MHPSRAKPGTSRAVAATRQSPTDGALREYELIQLLGWFVRVRWLFLAGLGIAILGAWGVFRVTLPLGKLLTIGGVVLGYNVLFFVHHRRPRRRAAPRPFRSRNEAALQVGLDLVALTMLLHFAGGAETPFVGFYLFHAIVGSVLLSKREAWLVGLATFGLFLTLVVVEQQGILPHYHAGLTHDSSHEDLRYLAIVSIVFLITLASTISIASSLANTLRLREHQLVVTQKALIKKSEDLERANAMLTERQRQLVLTEKQASLGQLVSGIAHEINNPIQFIYGNMAILSEAFSDVLPLLDVHSATRPDLRIARLDYAYFRKQTPVLLTDMANGAARIAAIVRDLKTFARRDEDGLDENVDLNDAVQSSLRLLHNVIRHLHVEEDLDPALPKLRGNLTKLEQVVVNTVKNAAEALGHERDGVIRICTRAERDGRRVRLSVQDNGAGIPPEVRDRIFDPFFTTKQRSGGTGLGLSITYGIIQQHKGEIVVDSHVGAGTAFHFLLPVNGAAA